MLPKQLKDSQRHQRQLKQVELFLQSRQMSMSPKSNGCGHIAHGWCGMTSWMEGHPLREETERSVGIWLFEDMVCQWGCIHEIITDNVSMYRAAVA